MDIRSSKRVWITGPSIKFTWHSHTPQRRCSGFYWSFVPVTNHLLLDIVTCLTDFGNDWYHTIYTIEIYTTHLHIKKTTTPSLAKWFSGVIFSIISPFSFTELILYIWQLQYYILWIMLKIIAFLIITLFARLWCEGWHFTTCGKQLHDHIFPLRRYVWAHIINLTPPLFTERSVPRQESERSCICVLGVSILPLSIIFPIGFWKCSDSGILYFILLAWFDLIFDVLTPLSAIFQLYHGDQS
jgi:hypothetical protein